LTRLTSVQSDDSQVVCLNQVQLDDLDQVSSWTIVSCLFGLYDH
jgi:hypothetical protein